MSWWTSCSGLLIPSEIPVSQDGNFNILILDGGDYRNVKENSFFRYVCNAQTLA